jgi:cyclic pyranopterin phosphate synthase
MLYTCLFATHGTDLRAPLRAGASDDELAAIVRNVWTARGDRYSEQRVELRLRGKATGKVEMNYIGG